MYLQDGRDGDVLTGHGSIDQSRQTEQRTHRRLPMCVWPAAHRRAKRQDRHQRLGSQGEERWPQKTEMRQSRIRGCHFFLALQYFSYSSLQMNHNIPTLDINEKSNHFNFKQFFYYIYTYICIYIFFFFFFFFY